MHTGIGSLDKYGTCIVSEWQQMAMIDCSPIEMLTATNMFVAIRAVLVLVRSSGIFLVDRNEQP